MDRIARGSIRSYAPGANITFAGGKGMWLWDEKGNRYIDLTCGFSVTNLGHCHQPIVAAVKEQVHQLDHVTGQRHTLQRTLSDRLVQTFSSRLTCKSGETPRVAFASSGARAVEIAIRCARAFRPGKVLHLTESFHGRTIALTEPQADLLVQPAEAHFPSCQRCPLERSFPACELACANALFEYIENHAGEISAILIEPILGVAGWVVPPNSFLQRVGSLTSRFEIVLIADEVQTALGRCGSWTRLEQLDIKPDLLVIGKSLAAGMAPISAALGREEIMQSPPTGSLTETFAANPIACAAAISTLKCIQYSHIFENVESIGNRLRHELELSLQNHAPFDLAPVVGGVGASCTLQFIGAPEDAANDARSFVECCLKYRLVTHLAGSRRERVVLLPPLNISNDELDEVCKQLDHAVAHACTR